MTTTTTQDLLAERRYNIQEARGGCKMTKAMCMAHVAVIDAELSRRRGAAS